MYSRMLYHITVIAFFDKNKFEPHNFDQILTEERNAKNQKSEQIKGDGGMETKFIMVY